MLTNWHPNIYVLASLMAVVSGLSAAVFVARQAPGNIATRPFTLMSATGSLWCLFPTVASLPLTESTLIWLARLTYVSGSICLPAYLHLSFAISGEEQLRLHQRFLHRAYITGGLFALLSFSPYLIAGLIRFAPHFAALGGPLYHPFVGFYVVCCGYGLFAVWKDCQKAVGL